MDDFGDLLERLQAYKDGDAEPSAEALAKREVAAQLRAFSNAIGASGASAQQLQEIADGLRAPYAILTAESRLEPEPPDTPAVIAGMRDFRDRSPVTGQANPLAPPSTLSADLDARVVRGEVTFGVAFEGAPGIVHGGFVAALLDEALGMACIFGGGPAMTAELTTRYRHHTPVATPLRVEARLDSVEGRKVRTSGELYHGDRVVVEASGLFIAVDASKFEQLAAARTGRGRSV